MKMYDLEVRAQALSMRPSDQSGIQTYARVDEGSILEAIRSLLQQGLSPYMVGALADQQIISPVFRKEV
jgi:hypothetical protein